MTNCYPRNVSTIVTLYLKITFSKNTTSLAFVEILFFHISTQPFSFSGTPPFSILYPPISPKYSVIRMIQK